jgi:DNA-binding MarR family transcriptional regulator
VPSPEPLSEIDALDLCVRVGQANAAITRRFDQALSAWHGVSFDDYLVLAHLARSTHGRMARDELGAAVGLRPSEVTRLLAPLERRGLVERQANPTDPRVADTTLTDAGRSLVNDVEATAGRIAAGIAMDAGWGRTEQNALVELLADLGAVGLPSAVRPS